MATTNAGAGPEKLGAAELLTKPVDFDLLKEQLWRLPTADD
jgi:hypothetical protein